MSVPFAPHSTAPDHQLGDRRIFARGLARSFAGKLAVAPIDLDLGPGGIIGLLGPNGSGKSTLLRMLFGLVRPDAGVASVDGVALAGDGCAIRRRCTYSPGELRLYGELRARDHLAWFVRGREQGAKEKALAIAAELGLPLEKRVRAYSHGMKRQLVFAAALAPDAAVRIFDEPTEGLDPSVRGRVLALLAEEAARGKTILLSSHHLGEVDRVCDRLVFLDRGRKLADESAEVISERARRIVRFVFDAGADMRAVAAYLSSRPGATVRIDGLRAVLELASGDPHETIAAVCSARDRPRPRVVEYGELSLSELYRDLYGVEGV